MNKITRTILLTGIAGLLTLFFGGCGGDDGSPAPIPAANGGSTGANTVVVAISGLNAGGAVTGSLPNLTVYMGLVTPSMTMPFVSNYMVLTVGGQALPSTNHDFTYHAYVDGVDIGGTNFGPSIAGSNASAGYSWPYAKLTIGVHTVRMVVVNSGTNYVLSDPAGKTDQTVTFNVVSGLPPAPVIKPITN